MWWSIPFLIIFPMCIGALLYCIHVQKIRKGIAYIATPAIMAATIDLVVTYFRNGGSPVDHQVYPGEEVLDLGSFHRPDGHDCQHGSASR